MRSAALGPGLVVDIPGRPPSWNHAYRNRRRTGQRYMTPEARAWKERVAWLTLDALAKTSWRPGDGQLVVNYWGWVGTPMDPDNVAKLMHDGLALGLRVDDARFLPRCQAWETYSWPEHVLVLVVNMEVG